MLALLTYHHLPILLFPAVATLGCCKGACFQSACYKRPLPTRAALAAVFAAAAAPERPAAVAPERAAATAKALDFIKVAYDFDYRANYDQFNRSLLSDLRRAAADNVSAVLVPGKYRDELELAVQVPRPTILSPPPLPRLVRARLARCSPLFIYSLPLSRSVVSTPWHCPHSTCASVASHAFSPFPDRHSHLPSPTCVHCHPLSFEQHAGHPCFPRVPASHTAPARAAIATPHPVFSFSRYQTGISHFFD